MRRVANGTARRQPRDCQSGHDHRAGRCVARRRCDRRRLPAPGRARSRRRDRERSPGRLEQLGRRAVRRARPAGALLANDPHLGIAMPSVWFMNGLHCRKVTRRLPVRRRRRLVPGRPRRRPRPQRADRVGRDERRPDVQDLFVEEVDPANPDHYLFRGRVRPVRGPQGDDQGRRRRRRRDRGPRDPPRPDPQRRRRASRGRSAAGARVDGDGRRRRHVRGDLPAQHRRDLRGVPGSVLARTARRPRTSSTPTSTGTSATSSRARSRSGAIPPIAAPASDPASDGNARVDGPHPVRGAAVAARSAERRRSSPRTTPRSTTEYPYFVAAEWDPGYRAKRIIALLEDVGGAA